MDMDATPRVVPVLAKHMDLQDLKKIISLRAVSGRLAFELGRRGDLELIRALVGMTSDQIEECGVRLARAPSNGARGSRHSSFGRNHRLRLSHFDGSEHFESTLLLEVVAKNVLLGTPLGKAPWKLLIHRIVMGAAQEGRLEVVRFFFSTGADPLVLGCTAYNRELFWKAVEWGRADVARFFLADREFFSALFEAGHLDVERLLFRCVRAADPSFFRLVASGPGAADGLTWQSFFYEAAYRANLALATCIMEGTGAGADQFADMAKAAFSFCVLARPDFYLGLRDRGWLDSDAFLGRLANYQPPSAKELKKFRRTIDLVVTDVVFCQGLRRKGVSIERLLFNASQTAVLARTFHQSLRTSDVLDEIRDRLRLKDEHFAALLLDFWDPDAKQPVLSPEQALLVTDGDFGVVFREDLWCPLDTGRVRRFKPAVHSPPQRGTCPWKLDLAAGNLDAQIAALLKGPGGPDDGASD